MKSAKIILLTNKEASIGSLLPLAMPQLPAIIALVTPVPQKKSSLLERLDLVDIYPRRHSELDIIRDDNTSIPIYYLA